MVRRKGVALLLDLMIITSININNIKCVWRMSVLVAPHNVQLFLFLHLTRRCAAEGSHFHSLRLCNIHTHVIAIATSSPTHYHTTSQVSFISNDDGEPVDYMQKRKSIQFDVINQKKRKRRNIYIRSDPKNQRENVHVCQEHQSKSL